MTERKERKASRFSRGSWLVLAAAAVLLLGSAAQLAYRFTLPTDGWSVYTEEIVESNRITDRNLVGAASDLREGDVILAVDGVDVSGEASSGYTPPPAGWVAGRTVTMLVRREGEEVETAVPVVNWTSGGILRYNTLGPAQIGFFVGAMLLLIVGWFTFLRRPEVPSARALLLFCTALGATAISGLLPDGLSVQFDLPAFGLVGFYSYAIFGVVLAPALLTFALLFPNPKKVIQRHPWLAAMPLLYGAALLVYLVAGGNAAMAWFGSMAMFALSIVSLIHSWFTQRDAASRAQLRWAVSGLVLGLSMFMLTFLSAFGLVPDAAVVDVLDAIASMGFAVVGLGLAVAILRYRLYDIDVILRKTLVYAVLSGLLLLVYFGSVLVLQTLVGRRAGEQSPLVIVLSTLLIAALFAPLRRRVQEGIDRRFFRSKVDAQMVLAQFAETARDETEVAALTAELRRVVQETMQPEGLSVWLREPSHE